MLIEICLLSLKIIAVYFLSINFVYAVLMLLSWLKIRRYENHKKNVQSNLQIPGVSFIIPAFNEETLIVETIQTYLALPQGKKEIIVINDGSHDQTFKLLQTMYQLRKETNELIYRSITQPELRVLEAPHMGKAQALNLGVEFATHDLICTMDADTIPSAEGVDACLKAFAEDKKLIAAGGVIQVLSSKVLKNNSPLKDEVNELLPTFQRIEYLRTFVCERLGWSYLGATVLISGAFCMIKRQAVKQVGGFSHRSITEDFDLIMRLRRYYQAEKGRFRILPVTTCYTQVPRTLKHLKLQRIRWQLGLVQTLCQHISLIFHPGHGPFGLLGVPYLWLVEVFSPILALVAWIAVPYALINGWITWELVLFYLGVGVVFNMFITLVGIRLDNKYLSRMKAWSCLNHTFHTVLIHFGYKQLNTWWRLIALMRSFRRGASWGEKPREEIIHQTI